MNNSLLSPLTSIAARILIQIAKDKQIDECDIFQITHSSKKDIESAIKLLVEKQCIKMTSDNKYDLLINPSVTTLYDITIITNDPRIRYLISDNLEITDELNRFYKASLEMNLNWLKSITIKDLTGEKSRRRI